MPLPPLPPSNTDRYWLDYATANAAHSMLCRTAPGVPIGEVVSAYDRFLTALTGALYIITITGMRFAQKGSDVSNPVTWSGPPAYGLDVEPENQVSHQLSFVGRSSTGRKTRVFVFGHKFTTPGDFRYSSVESPAIGAAIVQLEANDNTWRTIDETVTLWKLYANVGFNDHWIKEARKG